MAIIKKHLVSGLSFLFLLFSKVSTECNLPPAFWCDDINIAKQCGVLEQCHKWLTPSGNDAPLVQFTLYYESLCPDCKNFFASQLNPTYQKLHRIMNLTLVPYGNAQETKVGDKWKFNCQHGPNECQGNLIETCAINILNNITEYFPFIACMEASYELPMTAAKECGSKYALPYSRFLDCSESDLGNKWEHAMALKTDALSPTHTFVPWVTLNGVHTKSIQNQAQTNLVKLICDAYRGVKPSICP